MTWIESLITAYTTSSITIFLIYINRIKLRKCICKIRNLTFVFNSSFDKGLSVFNLSSVHVLFYFLFRIYNWIPFCCSVVSATQFFTCIILMGLTISIAYVSGLLETSCKGELTFTSIVEIWLSHTHTCTGFRNWY